MKRFLVSIFVIVFALNSLGQTNSEFRKIEFGFNIHYLVDANKFDKAYERIQKDSFTRIRAFEPFTKSISADFDEGVVKIKHIQNYGFDLLLSFSNFPYDEALVEQNKSNEIAKKYSHFTNRFPPNNKVGYQSALKNFLDKLQKEGALQKLSFEIGNEPDAERYFWGSAEDWKQITDAIHSTLKPYKRPLMCCGFTSGLIFSEVPERKVFLDYLNSKDFPETIDFSYHVYMKNSFGETNLENSKTDKSRGGIITEFGLFTSFSENNEKLNNSDFYMCSMAELLEFTYINNIETVYLFPLMDTKNNSTKLGYFDSNGLPKQCYLNLLLIKDVVSEGYKITRSEGSLKIEGIEKVLIIPFEKVKIAGKVLTAASYNNLQRTEINKGEWAIYRK